MSLDPRYMDDLFTVGPRKPLGYLPVSTILACGWDVTTVSLRAAQAGNEAVWYPGSMCNVASGAVFVWHEASLQALLDANRDILIAADWPLLVNRFVLQVSNTMAPIDTPIYELIGVAFNDRRFQEPKWVRR